MSKPFIKRVISRSTNDVISTSTLGSRRFFVSFDVDIHPSGSKLDRSIDRAWYAITASGSTLDAIRQSLPGEFHAVVYRVVDPERKLMTVAHSTDCAHPDRVDDSELKWLDNRAEQWTSALARSLIL